MTAGAVVGAELSWQLSSTDCKQLLRRPLNILQSKLLYLVIFVLTTTSDMISRAEYYLTLYFGEFIIQLLS